jgi:hypothetical protein
MLNVGEIGKLLEQVTYVPSEGLALVKIIRIRD